jgi:hypothetical protein
VFYGTLPLWLFAQVPSNNDYLVLALSVITKKMKSATPKKIPKTGESSVRYETTTPLVYYFYKKEILAAINREKEYISPNYLFYTMEFNIDPLDINPELFEPVTPLFHYTFNIKSEWSLSQTLMCLKFHYGGDHIVSIGILMYIPSGQYKDPKTQKPIEIDYSQSKEKKNPRRIWFYEASMEIKLDLFSEDKTNETVTRGCIRIKDLEDVDKQKFRKDLRDSVIYFFTFKNDLRKHLQQKSKKYIKLPVFGISAKDLSQEKNVLGFQGSDLVPTMWWDILNVSSKFVI